MESAMAFIPVPQTVKTVLEMSQNNVPIVNIFNIEVGTPPTITELNACALAVRSWWETQYAPAAHPSLAFVSVTATDISVVNGLQTILNTTTVPVGGGAGAAAAANAAAVVSLRTGFAGRSFRGRLYLGGLVQSDLTSAQYFASGAASALQAQVAALITALNTIGFYLGVVSRYTAGAARVIGIITRVTGLVTDTRVDSQRRRTAN